MLATGGFTLSSLAAGLAPGLGARVAARVVQGAFAAVLFALVPAVTVRAVRPELAGVGPPPGSSTSTCPPGSW
ncbi:hypothetical protein [Actinomadura nitritigenes]|uniref:hypothetical protein n=1 Tax=Actinomadura nitritigenes TaxID=134602 RepID=UPI003D8C0B71